MKFRSPASVLGTTEATRPSSAHKEMSFRVGTPIGLPPQLSTAGIFLRFTTSTSCHRPCTLHRRVAPSNMDATPGAAVSTQATASQSGVLPFYARRSRLNSTTRLTALPGRSTDSPDRGISGAFPRRKRLVTASPPSPPLAKEPRMEPPRDRRGPLASRPTT